MMASGKGRIYYLLIQHTTHIQGVKKSRKKIYSLGKERTFILSSDKAELQIRILNAEYFKRKQISINLSPIFQFLLCNTGTGLEVMMDRKIPTTLWKTQCK